MYRSGAERGGQCWKCKHGNCPCMAVNTMKIIVVIWPEAVE